MFNIGRSTFRGLLTVCATLLCGRALAAQNDGDGVSRALAIDRAARVSDVRYALHFTLAEHADAMPGKETLRFTLQAADAKTDLLLDFRDGQVLSADLNGHTLGTDLVRGHLRLPSAALQAGANVVTIDFTSRIAAAGAAITRYADKEDGSEYIYSLFVPMDASMAFPCFDQPDLKARFSLAVTAPREWTVIGNTKASRIEFAGKTPQWTFPETRPISTYLFAFAAGPWQRVHPTAGMPDVYVRKSQVKRAEPEVPQLQDITARGMSWLAEYFKQPFPFSKYDIVLIPGFPFGGMEHAGATFLREDGVLFRSAPTASDRFGRDILTLHELTHQWFGDLVTMRWFDDLWLKEGFAQYMAYRAEEALQPGSQPWKHFYEDIKPLAYGIDETEGTTPIFQDIPNLKDAKSAYGAIVYQKAPAILKQLEFWLGPDAFREGLRLYLREHAYANAQWGDLIAAFHTSSGQDVRAWADAWVLRRGMPEVQPVIFGCTGGKVSDLALTQHDVLGTAVTWPISLNVLLAYPAEKAAYLPGQPASPQPLQPSAIRYETIRVSFDTRSVEVDAAVGRPCPAFVFANGSDAAYGRFLLDGASLNVVQPRIGGIADPLLRSMLWGALWDNVHVAASAPRDYVELVLANLPHEEDETLARIEGGHATTALHRYMSAEGRAAYVPRLETIATDRMLHAPTLGLRIISFRTLSAGAETETARATVKELLSGKLAVPDLTLRPLDRWGLIGRLVSLGDVDAEALVIAELKQDHSGDGDKNAFAARAGTPSAASKVSYFAQYRLPPADPAAKPEDWLTQSLRPFNSWNQSSLTQPYLMAALDQLPEIKRDRKIFFLGAWLAAFLDGQVDASAAETVHTWLRKPGIDADLRRKVVENSDELERTVRIRQKFPF